MNVAATENGHSKEGQQCTYEEDEIVTCTQTVERPLAGIIAYVDVRSGTKSCINTSKSISHSLMALGASIAPRLTKDVTHMVFKDGKTSRERMENLNAYLVNPLWVDSCKRCNERVSEAKYPVISQDSGDSPVVLGRIKRIKSMQPKPLSEEAITRSVERNRKRRREGELESRSKKAPPSRFVLASDEEEVADNDVHYRSTDSSDIFELPAVDIRGTPAVDLQKSACHKPQQGSHTPSALPTSFSPANATTPPLSTSKAKPTSRKTKKSNKPTKETKASANVLNVDLQMERVTPGKRKRMNQTSDKCQPIIARKSKSLKKSVVEDKENERPISRTKPSAADQEKNNLADTVSNSASGEERKSPLVKTEGSANKRSRKRVSFDRQKPTLVLTSVQQRDLEIIYAIAKKLGQFQISRCVNDSTTHVVSGAPRRTINVLAATAKGCWILSLEWVWKSLEAGRWLNEEAFEMVTEFPAAQFFRLERQQEGSLYRPTLFHPAGSIYVSSDTSPAPQQLELLLGYAGAKITASKRKADVCVSRSAQDSTTATVVSESWVLDSISEHALLPQEDFIVDENAFSPSSSPEL